jgi:hypothetical protein
MQKELVIELSTRFFRLRCVFATSPGQQKDSEKIFRELALRDENWRFEHSNVMVAGQRWRAATR